jgi:hypothetical protein
VKQGYALLPFFFNFALEHTIRRVQENQERLKLNGTHWLLAYDNNTVGKNIDSTKKNTEAVLHASKKVGLEVNPNKTKYMFMSQYWKVGQKHSIKTAKDPLKMWQSSNIWEQH